MNTTPQASQFFEIAAYTLGNLWGRWQDEKDYEDIKDYAAPLEPLAAKSGVKIEKMTARPFGCVFSVADRQFTLTCARGAVSYKRIK